MTWTKLDDRIRTNRKIMALSFTARWVYVAGLVYCNEQLTDGRIDTFALPSIAAGVPDIDGVVKELTTVIPGFTHPLWETIDGGWQIHDFLEFNPSAAQVRAEREIARRRAAMNDNPELAKAIKSRDGNRCRYCGRAVNWRDRKGEGGGTYDHVIPITRGGKETVDNIVVCCRSCNSRKGARTPDEAGMTLLNPSLNPSSINQDGIKPESSRNLDIPYPYPLDSSSRTGEPERKIGYNPPPRSEALSVYEQVMGGLVNSLDGDLIGTFIDEAESHRRGLPDGAPGADVDGDTWVCEAIREANASKTQTRINGKFVGVVLDRWYAEGYKAPFRRNGRVAGASHVDENLAMIDALFGGAHESSARAVGSRVS